MGADYRLQSDSTPADQWLACYRDDPTYPNGFANYYMGNYGVMGTKAPLIPLKFTSYTAATKR